MNKNKIAVLGNMNNAGFVLMRHLRDLGEDAHLLLYKNDGEGYSSHFNLEADSWDADKWLPYVHNLPVANGYGAALSNYFLYKFILWIIYFLRKLIGSPNAIFSRPSTKSELSEFKEKLMSFDKFIGSGNSPAIFQSLDMSLDIFFPYAVGIENYDDEIYVKFIKSKNLIVSSIAKKNRSLQKQGIQSSRHCLNTDITYTKDAFDKMGVNTHFLYPPHVYDRYDVNAINFSSELKDALSKIKTSKFKIISHSRHYWIKDLPDKPFFKTTKNNDWLLRAYSKFLDRYPDSQSVLILLEYGQDFEHSKTLCEDLQISSNVLWLPQMKRKELLKLISFCDVGAGEFLNEGVMMGSTGYEILHNCKPLIQGKLDLKKIREITNKPMAPGFYINNIDELTEVLCNLYQDKELRNQLAEDSYNWRKQYTGSASAQEIVKLLLN